MHAQGGGLKSADFGPLGGSVALMATRTTSTPRGSSSSKSGGTGRSAAASKTSGAASKSSAAATKSGRGSTARTKQAAAVEPQAPLPLRMLSGFWQGGIGHVVGAGVRRIGYDVSDLHPDDRRDGAALFNLVLGIAIATFAWWGSDRVAPGHGLQRGQRHVRVDVPDPAFMLFVCAFRLFRKPQDGRGNNRVGIGFMIMTLAGSGLAHVIGGLPTVAEGFDGLRRAGGMLGFLAAAPLAAIHVAVPVVLYGLLAFVSVLIVTATPFGAIPSRIRGGAYEHLMGVDLMDESGKDAHDRSYLYENDTAAKPRKKKRMRFFGKDEETDTSLEGYVGDEAFEHAIVDDDETPGASAPRVPPGVRRPTQAEIAVGKIKPPKAWAPRLGSRTPPKPFRFLLRR